MEIYLQGLIVLWTWSSCERELHINVLEMTVAQLVLNAFLDRVIGKTVVLMNNNITT